MGRARERLVQNIIRDATREEETRLELRRAARELERLNHMKNSFLGLASHELKTPLTIIMGYLERLATEYPDQMDDEARDVVGQVSVASERLAEIIRDMVDVSMLDSNTIDLVSQEVAVNDLVRRVADGAQGNLRQRSQTLQLEAAEDLPLIRCDLDRMVQALGSVLDNAIKFAPDGGRIKVRARLVDRAGKPEKSSHKDDQEQARIAAGQSPWVEISIVDQGAGIAAEDRQSIFEKFNEIGALKGDSSDRLDFKSHGAGLGLSIARGVA